MTNEEIINRLKDLISDWEYEHESLERMILNWDEDEDPGSDPGLQFEQDEIVQNCWKELSEFCRNAFNENN